METAILSQKGQRRDSDPNSIVAFASVSLEHCLDKPLCDFCKKERETPHQNMEKKSQIINAVNLYTLSYILDCDLYTLHLSNVKCNTMKMYYFVNEYIELMQCN